jgi:hypothetical protein
MTQFFVKRWQSFSWSRNTLLFLSGAENKSLGVRGKSLWDRDWTLCWLPETYTPVIGNTHPHVRRKKQEPLRVLRLANKTSRTKRPTTNLHYESNVPENVPVSDSATRCLAFFSFPRYPISFSCAVCQRTLSKTGLFRPALSHHTQAIHSSNTFTYAPSVQKLSPPFPRTLNLCHICYRSVWSNLPSPRSPTTVDKHRSVSGEESITKLSICSFYVLSFLSLHSKYYPKYCHSAFPNDTIKSK